MKRALGIIIGVAVSVFFFALSMRGTSLEELKAGFANANYLTLPLMLAMLFGFYWLKAMRWAWLLSPVKPLTTNQLFPPLVIGFAANNILPAHLGEFVRVFVVNRQYKIPATTVLSTVVLERIFDVVAILALFGLGLMFTDTMPDEYRRNAMILGGLCVVAVVAVAVYLVWTEWFLKVAGAMMGWVLPQGIAEKILGMLRAGADGLAALKSGKMVALIALSSLAQWLLNGLIAYVALKAFHVPVTPTAGLIVTGVTAFGVTIPSTPGYVGVIQYCFKISIAAVGLDVNPSLVFASSLYYHLCMYIPVTGLGLYYLFSQGLRLRDLANAAETQAVAVDSESTNGVIDDEASECPPATT